MKRFMTILVATAVVMTGFVLSTSVSNAAKKKDRVCINRCISDYRFCLKKAKSSAATYKERISSENECIRQKNICMGVCPDQLN
ncbi:MAG: hypothetical protein KA369_16775 [Spirochaetes bacterium]|nr:hypothetical protein [Spirochaetota bacterium]